MVECRVSATSGVPSSVYNRPLPIIDIVLPHNKLLTYTSLFMFCYQMFKQHRNNASKFVNRPTPYVRRTSQPDTKTKTTPQPHPRVVEALNRLLASTFTVCLRRFCYLVCFPFLMNIIGFWDHWCFGSSFSIVTDCTLDGWCLIPGRAEISVCFVAWMKLDHPPASSSKVKRECSCTYTLSRSLCRAT